MGNELATMRLMHDLERLERLERAQAALSREDPNVPMDIAHGWDPQDCSSNMTVLENGLAVKRGKEQFRTDAVRGKQGYGLGIHVWQIIWPQNMRGSHAVIGVASYQAPLACRGYDSLVGNNDESMGWDIARNVLLFNDCVMRRYPDNAMSNFVAPETITVILDMNVGSLAFKGGRIDYGVALSGLRVMGKPLFPAISATFGDCIVRIKYLGNTDQPRPSTMPSAAASTSDELVFHSKCGQALTLSNGNKTATRRSPNDEFHHGIALTSRPLKTDEMFEFNIDQTVGRWSSSIEFGVTTNNPASLNLPPNMTECREGKTWIYTGNEVQLNANKVEDMQTDIDDLKAGNKLGVKRASDGRIKFFVNGNLQGSVFAPSEPVYGVADVYGNACGVTITSKQPQPSLQKTTPQPTPVKKPERPLKFHRRSGKNIELEQDNTKAQRRDFMDTVEGAVVITDRALENDELFEIRVDKVLQRWSQGMNIGVLKMPPGFEFPDTITSSSCREYVWIWSGKQIIHDGAVEKELEDNLDKVKIGDTVGVQRTSDGKLNVYHNGKDLGVVAKDIPERVHGIADIHGNVLGISIKASERDDDAPVSPRSAKSEIETIMIKMEQTIAMMKMNDTSAISQVCEAVRENLDNLYKQHKDRQHRQMMGDKLAELDGANVIAKYLNFLRECGLEQPKVWECYQSLRNVCWNYTDASHKCARSFGQTESLLRVMAKDLDKYKDKYKQEQKFNFLVLSAFGVLHNCAKVDENKPMYRKLNILQVLLPYTLPNNDHPVIMRALMTMSYIVEGDTQHLVQANEASVEFILTTLKAAVNNTSTHQADGFHAYEIVIGLTNLASNPTNRMKTVVKGGVPLFVKLMQIGDNREKECAINAVWVMTEIDTLVHIQQTAGLLDMLRKLKKEGNEVIKQAAERALLKLEPPTTYRQHMGASDMMSTVKRTPGQCDYKELCIRFMKSLNLPDAYFNTTHNRCYCNVCHNERGDTLYYTRGQPPKDYGLPIGWYRFALQMPAKATALNAMDKWHRAFHGTKKESVLKILEGGELLMPGDVALGGLKIKEREGHFTDDRKPMGFDTKKIFVSPSIRYAGHNAYSTPSKYVELPDKKYIAKVAFQVLIEPASYEVGEQTIGETSQIDPKFSNQEIEWSTAQRGSTILFGILVKVEDSL